MPVLPAQLRRLPALMRQHLVAACDGDFTRLRFEDDGSVTVLNRSERVVPASKPVSKQTTTKTTAKTTAKSATPAVRPAGQPQIKAKPARAPRSLPPVSLPPVPGTAGADTGASPTAKPAPARKAAATRVKQAAHEGRFDTLGEPIARTPVLPAPLPPVQHEPQPQQERRAQDVPVGVERRAERRQVLDRPVPAAFDIRTAWEQVNVGESAMAMLEACRQGLPEVLPLDMHADVLALEGINLDLAVSAVRHPHFVEVAGKDTAEKGYPILRFHRGDVMVVVGLREARYPICIAVYVTSRLDPDIGQAQRGVGAKTGGGGRRKQAGLPGTPKALMNRLAAYGVDFVYNELSDSTAQAVFRGQDLGKVKLEGVTRAQCESDYQRLLRKVEAIQRRD